MTRLQIVEYPMQPGICRVCGVSYGIRPFVDTSLTGDFCNRPHWNPLTNEPESEVDINLAGAVYFCESCIINMGELVGMMDSIKAQRIRSELEQLQEVVADLTAKNLGLEKIVDGYRDLGALSISVGAIDRTVTVPVVPDPLPEEIKDPELFDSGPLTTEVTSGTDFGESEISEHSNHEEPSGVSDDDVSESGESRDESDNKSSADVLGF